MATSTPSAPARSVPERPSRTSRAPIGAPLFLLNLKAYPNTFGAAAERMARLLETRGREHGVAVAIAPSAADIGRLAAALDLPVLSQHIDAGGPGARTGWLTAAAVRGAGGRGSLLNHSEHRGTIEGTRAQVAALREVRLASVVCARDARESARLASLLPEYLAVEPPELIGGTISVSTARPEVISETVHRVRRVAPSTVVLCGAGVHDREDVRRALALGAEGVLVASAVTRATDPKAAIDELLAGFATAR